MKQPVKLLGCEPQQPSEEKQPEGIKIETINEFDAKVFKDTDIWDHAFDESNEIEIPKYLNNPMVRQASTQRSQLF